MDGLAGSIDKMRADDVSDAAIETFRDLYTRWQEGETGLLPEADIEPLSDLPSISTSSPEPGEDAHAALDATVVLKLNGGLGHEHGDDEGEVAAGGQGRADVPRHHRPPGARRARARSACGCRSCS